MDREVLTQKLLFTLHSTSLIDYEALGIQNYWVVNYAGLGGRLGHPKRPTLSIYSMTDEGEYDVQQFRGSDRLIAAPFPDLTLTAEQVFAAGV